MKFVKNILFTLTFMLLVSMFASGVYAAASFNVDTLNVGSTSQVRGQDTTALLHLTNNGTDALTISLSSTLASTYNTRFSVATVTLAPGASSDVTVTMYVPTTQASSKTLLTGGIVATSNVAGLAKTANVYLTTMSMLSISKVTLETDGTEHSLRRDETYSDTGVLVAGTSITINVYVKNSFTSSQDITIENIGVDIRGSGDLDLDESDDMADLDYGDKDSISFNAEIPTDAEDGDDYDIDIKVTGRDEYGVLYVDTFSTNIEVKKESHEILITGATLSPKTVSLCTPNNRVTLNVDLKNNGRYNENRVALTIDNTDLDIAQRFNQIELDRDDVKRETYTFNVPNSTLPGTYDLLLTSYYSSDIDSVFQTISLNVLPCQAASTTTNNQAGNTNAGNTIIQPQIPPVVSGNGATPVYGTSSFADGTLYITLLVIAVVVMISILIILLVKFVF